ncbi:MAG: RnfABCDGE type electron transport complex subunit G [Clostridiales bacterium]|nr:RnfABCDGE type electron transport complex subunit G [Clostridiales bacterium]
MREIIKPALSLFVITVVSAFLLGYVFTITEEPIKAAQAAEKNKKLAELFPEASEFTPNFLLPEFFSEDAEPASAVQLPEGGQQVDGAFITEALTAKSASGEIKGYVISAQSPGYGGVVGILAAINPDGTVRGISIASSDETAGLGLNASNPEFTGQFKGKSGELKVTKVAPSENEIEAITSATITTSSVTGSVNAALKFFQSNFS